MWLIYQKPMFAIKLIDYSKNALWKSVTKIVYRNHFSKAVSKEAFPKSRFQKVVSKKIIYKYQ